MLNIRAKFSDNQTSVLLNRLPVGGGCVYVLVVLHMFFFAFFGFLFCFFSVRKKYETTIVGNG